MCSLALVAMVNLDMQLGILVSLDTTALETMGLGTLGTFDNMAIWVNRIRPNGPD